MSSSITLSGILERRGDRSHTRTRTRAHTCVRKCARGGRLYVRESRSMLSRKLSRVLSFLFFPFLFFSFLSFSFLFFSTRLDSTRLDSTRLDDCASASLPFFPLKDCAWLGISPGLCTAYTDAAQPLYPNRLFVSIDEPTYILTLVTRYLL